MWERAKFIKINDEITLVDDAGESTFYIVTGKDKAMLIDTASGYENVVEIARHITDLPLIVVNTHGHGDHVGGNLYCEEAWVHPDDLELSKRCFEWPEIKQAMEKFGLKPCPFKTLEIGQIFELGDHALEVIDLKGHTKGSVGLLDRKHRVLFTGDGLNPHIWMQLGDSLPMSELEKTLEAVEKEHGHEFDYILTGHAQGTLPRSLLDKLLNGVRELLRGETENDTDYHWFDMVSRAHQISDIPGECICYEPYKLMKPEADAYLYGQVLYTHSMLLKGDFPELDTYGEIERMYHLTGGETGTCATVLESLGMSCRLDGNFLGRLTRKPILDFYKDKNVDLSLMISDPSFDGEEDYVLIDKNTRTCFGQFGAYFANPVHRWKTPKIEELKGCKVAGIDPFFLDTSDYVAKLCVEAKLPYVTIDCKPDSYLHIHSAINAVSNEFIGNEFPNEDREALLKRYMEASDGLTIFTLGAKEVMYGRKGGEIKRFKPYSVKVESTLGAGDTFKAGCVYALFKGMSDDDAVAFASAVAGCACMKFPIPLNPPTLERVAEVQKQG